MKNELIKTWHYTDALDEIIIQLTKAKIKHVSKGGLTMSTKITYTRQGDDYLPDLKLPEQEPREIGIWGCG